jgi:hypothetical protein
LNKCFDLGSVAPAVCSNGFLPDFGKEKRVAARSFWASGASARLWQKCFVLRVERRVGEVKMNFSFNPCAKLPHCGCLGLLVFEDGGGVPNVSCSVPFLFRAVGWQDRGATEHSALKFHTNR